MRHHYVYRSYEPLGRSYIGCRSCDCSVNEDSYMGSYTDKTFSPTCKEILAVCNTREEAMRTEMFFHEMYDVARNPMFANRAKATSTGFTREGVPHSEETIKKFLGENNSQYGKPRSAEVRGRISATMTGRGGEDHHMYGRTLPKETREKMSEAKAGEKHPMYGKCHTEESRQKNREAHTGENNAVTGTKWWVNANNQTTRQAECPGEGWINGRKWKEG